MLDLSTLPHNTPPHTVAAIDLGSNSFHMIVARIQDRQLQVIDRLREMVRLAAGLDEHKVLSQEAQQRAIACLERFGQRLRGMTPEDVRVVGTNTLRTAKNARQFLRAAERALGFEIEIIAGREEARLIYQGVAHSLANSNEQRLVIDIGGGSTEFIIGQKLDTLQRESLYMGCVTMSQRYFPEGILKAKAMRRAEIATRLELQAIAEDFRALGWEKAIGASGTIRAIEKIVRAEGWSDYGISYSAMQKLRSVLLDAGDIKKVKLQELKEERLPVFAGGFAVLMGIFEELHIDTLSVSDGALREGLIYDLIGRIAHEDIRDQTIQALSNRYQVDTAQAQRVEKTALACLAQIAPAWGLTHEEYQNMLIWAARLHEIGLAIAHNQYHKHGAYILNHSDLAGFSHAEQSLLAMLVRAHRRRFPTAEELAQLPETELSQAIRLCVILRVAVLLHRSQNASQLPPLNLQAHDNKLHLSFPHQWLEQYPLTQADLEIEHAYLAEAGIQFTFTEE
jgi:exopolyphosphatase / guanosine-5'-triphosphate,3'-diphosphate pyrophosphatase